MTQDEIRAADEARWERIYREKFEDPGYYALRSPLSRSSLAEPLRSSTARPKIQHSPEPEDDNR